MVLLQAENGEAAESDKKVARRGFVRSDSFMSALGPTLVRQPLSQWTGSRDAAIHLHMQQHILFAWTARIIASEPGSCRLAADIL